MFIVEHVQDIIALRQILKEVGRGNKQYGALSECLRGKSVCEAAGVSLVNYIQVINRWITVKFTSLKYL